MKKIFLIDHCDVFLESTVALLQDHGYEVRTSGCSSPGHPAMGLLDKDIPDAILVDVGVPYKGERIDKGGWECLLRLKTRKATKDIPLIAYTIQASLSEDARAKLQELRVPVLQYPFDSAVLLSIVEKATG